MPRARRLSLALVPVVLWAAATIGVAPGIGISPALAAPTCSVRIEPGEVIAQTPVERLILAAQRVWPTTTGQAVTVAVLDTGVDARHPQLRGAVGRGWDLVADAPGGTVDCFGQGTAVASLIGARPAQGIGFAGIAPGTTILPVRVAERTTSNAVDSAALAKAIRIAADRGADVINISVVAADTAALRAAVAYAQRRDVVLVAAAGTRAAGNLDPTSTDPPSYPAAYPEVLGVGAVDPDGQRLTQSPVGPYVDIVAPGANVVAAARIRGHTVLSGTAAAAPAVSAVAALVRSAFPDLTASEVTHRLLATANPVPGGPGNAGYGRGMVDPLRAVTEVPTGGTAVHQAGLPPREVDVDAQRREARWRAVAATAVAIAVGTTVALVGCAGVLALRRRLRRGRVTGGVTQAGEAIADDDDLAARFFTAPRPPLPR